MKKLVITVLSLSLTFMYSCNRDCYQVDEVNSSYIIEVGKSFEVTFNQQTASTGYSWKWTNEENNKHLKLISQESHKCSNIAGGNNVESFKIEGTASRQDSVVMIYAQSWDNTTIAEKKVIYVTVK